MEKLTFELFKGRTLHVGYFRHVKNSAQLRAAIMQQSVDAAFINANMIVDAFQIQAAAARTLLSDEAGSLTTKSIHAELVFNLSGSRNVSESFRRFGIADDSEAIVVCVVDADDAKLSTLQQQVEGTLTPWNELGQHLQDKDIELIRKFYRIQPDELRSSTLIDAIVCRIATKTCNK